MFCQIQDNNDAERDELVPRFFKKTGSIRLRRGSGGQVQPALTVSLMNRGRHKCRPYNCLGQVLANLPGATDEFMV